MSKPDSIKWVGLEVGCMSTNTIIYDHVSMEDGRVVTVKGILGKELPLEVIRRERQP